MAKDKDFIDTFKDEINKRKQIEGNEIEKQILESQIITDNPYTTTETELVSISIGSAFYFGVDGHNQLNSPSSLLGDMRAGSEVKVI